ncbi:MAG: GNAT family N-acetyltransferase [Nitrosopumilaceae archaeon]
MASLRPVDDSEETINLLTEWRNKFWDSFASKFEATKDRTRLWLRSQVMENPNRILFLIRVDSQKIGHIGIFLYDELQKIVEIDNVLRGIRNGNHGLMEKVTKNIIQWVFDDLRFEKIRLRVFSDNYKAINLYERCHMVTVDAIPLKRIFTNDGWKWEPAVVKENQYAERYHNVMEISRQSYSIYKNEFLDS